MYQRILDIAEVRALAHELMYMKDWLETIVDYLKMMRCDILTTKGRVTHKQVIDKAHEEYEKYRKKQDELLSTVEQHFDRGIKELEKLEYNKGRIVININEFVKCFSYEDHCR